ncbi:MAG: manganese efflux pump [Candidatus Binatus sp.]|uniref:manganese efflux pump MntP n=1 Tax=Candidatus Binatus sp. TaxID=2811406 RepID=UPI003C70992B
MSVPHDIILTSKILGVAVAVGLDVLAISVGVGVMQLALDARLRLGFAFAGAEIAMQVVGYELGAGAGRLLGEVATYIGLALLATIGCLMIRSSFRHEAKSELDVTRGAGLLITSLSISLDSLGVGIALPAVGIPLIPMLITVSITTSIFTFIGLEFGARLGERYEHGAERAAGAMLIVLAALFAIEQFV